MATQSPDHGAGVTERSAAGWRQRGWGPGRSRALPAAAARGCRHRGRMRRGRDGAGGRGRGGAAPVGEATPGFLPLSRPGVPEEQGRRERGCRTGPALDISLRESPPGCLCPGSFCHLLSGSLVPPARAAAAFSDAAAPPQLFTLLGFSEVGLSFDLFKFSVCANTHIFLYGQRRGNPSLRDGRFPNARLCEPGRGNRDPGALNRCSHKQQPSGNLQVPEPGAAGTFPVSGRRRLPCSPRPASRPPRSAAVPANFPPAHRRAA